MKTFLEKKVKGFILDVPNLDACNCLEGPDNAISNFDSLSDSVSKVLEKCPNSKLGVSGDFSVHNSSRHRHSKTFF